MPDWGKLVRERLGKLQLPPTAQDGVVHELAAHLEDLYHERLAAGESEAHALQGVLSHNWPTLAKHIEDAKRKETFMNDRTKQLWVPALISLTASTAWMMLLQIADSKLRMPWKHAGLAYLPYVVWVITLPVIGEISGYFSLQAGSKSLAPITVVVFPSIVMSFLWLVLAAIVFARRSPHAFQTINFAYGFLLWVVVPAVALWAGTLPLSKAEN